MIQHTHHSTEFKEKKFPLVVILDNISGPANVGSIFRLADAYNVERLILCGKKVDLESNRLRRTARSTISHVEYEEHEDTFDLCQSLKTQGYALVALEITSESVPVHSIKYSDLNKAALILGNERSGIDENVLGIADRKLHIEMFGKNSSMNVAQAAAIALFEISKSLPPVSNK